MIDALPDDYHRDNRIIEIRMESDLTRALYYNSQEITIFFVVLSTFPISWMILPVFYVMLRYNIFTTRATITKMISLKNTLETVL